MDQPRCPAVDLGFGLRCAQTPGHTNAHAAIWHGQGSPARMRRWLDGEEPVDNGRDRYGDLTPAAGMSWALVALATR